MGESMTTEAAPLLTATMATDCVPADNLNADAYYARRVALQALADGRTACVRAMTREQCRAAFEAYWCPPDHDEAPGFGVHKQFAWEAWLACARANKLVKEKS